MRIGLLSDVHATPGPVEEALTLFRRAGVDAIFCAGDIAGYGVELEQTVALLRESGCQAILGNHDLWWLEEAGEEAVGPVADYLRALPTVRELSLAGRRIALVHASPPASLMNGIRLLDEDGALLPGQKAFWSERLRDLACDVLVVGHTHQVFAQRLGPALVINPGSTCFNHTCMLLSLPELEVEVLPLANREPVLSWSWRGGWPGFPPGIVPG